MLVMHGDVSMGAGVFTYVHDSTSTFLFGVCVCVKCVWGGRVISGSGVGGIDTMIRNISTYQRGRGEAFGQRHTRTLREGY
jgi:hypothetical protein